MSYKDILVHVDNSKACATRLKIAIDLAEKHGAHLTGIFVIPEIQLPLYDTGPYPAELFEIEEEYAKKATAEGEETFKKAVDKTDASTEWRAERGDPASVVEKHARYSDMVIVGQADPEDETGLGEIADQLVLSLGRPLLVIPYISKGDAFGKKVMIAWDGGPYATRAAHEAMPFLEAASEVEVVAVNPEDAAAGHGEIPGADFSLHLARHGVKATAESYSAHDIGVGDLILSRISDEGVDMLVMGAYGHSRARELVLGGVTRHVLQHMTVPALMSH